ncbi:hypothetical protein [Actinokineospora bangkokensis]|uniref:Uncharacterized protein n=1 Tax=Actinokineospora bangkokensis TaxID=1193682 RepID=A0A1Q9LPM0_9PSEU|nr:hypothetical protein [Actinokineospora bangkokensis]OLR93970.1 hypothetical protein BJP25_13335 [Actinokineospora bangkokensis]
MPTRHRARAAATACLALLVPIAPVLTAPAAVAASSAFCTDGSFTVLGKNGKSEFRGTVTAPAGRFSVVGRYTRFDVDPATFAVHDYAFTGAANPGDMTGGRPTPVFAGKVPDLRGAVLSSPITLEVRKERLEISRSGGGASVKVQAKDCAQGGIFQMEPARADGTRTRVVHTLGAGAHYFDNQNFRDRLGQYLGSGCADVTTGPPGQACVRVTPRVNITSDSAPRLILRDSAQVATRIRQPECGPDLTNALGLAETRDHCGAMSVWDVASGGRLGMVTGEDATEVANPPTACTADCEAGNQVNGTLAVLGFPAPVAAASKLGPATSTTGLADPLTAP